MTAEKTTVSSITVTSLQKNKATWSPGKAKSQMFKDKKEGPPYTDIQKKSDIVPSQVHVF